MTDEFKESLSKMNFNAKRKYDKLQDLFNKARKIPKIEKDLLEARRKALNINLLVRQLEEKLKEAKAAEHSLKDIAVNAKILEE